MNKRVKAKWVKALRSGKYKQGRGTLKDENEQYCCLGVLCESQNKPTYGEFPTSNFLTSVGLSEKKAWDLANWNDDGKPKPWSFKRIAAYVERYL